MREVESRAIEAYQEQFGAAPAVVASAPGRANLIGEHTDYNGGFVLPAAIDFRVACAVGAGRGSLYSSEFHELRRVAAVRNGSWADYPGGVAPALLKKGQADRFRAAFAGNVPLDAGLSSSAAIEASTALALNSFFGLEMSRKELALVCQRAENAFVGVNSGIMDQYSSMLCEGGAALLIDCRSLESRTVALNLKKQGLVLLVCDTRVKRGLKGTEYNERRASCEAAARLLGVSQLRDATPADLDRLDGVLLKRARHVVTESERVLRAVESLGKQDFATFGDLMVASHGSLRDDYEVSTAQLDEFVGVARAGGALGARLTGAGFGGCAIALIEERAADGLEESVAAAFREREFKPPVFYRFEPSAGAEIVSNISERLACQV